MNEQKNLIRGTLTFLNGRIYKGELSPIDGEFNGIIEIKEEGSYPIKFTFKEGKLFDFNGIADLNRITTLLYGYNPKFGIIPDKKPFNKEMVSDLFDFEKYKNEGSETIHIMIQHRIGNYDGDNIGFMPEGNGTLTYGNGDFYEGDFKNGVPCGRGKLIFNKHGIIEGEFKDGMLNGEGKSLYPNRGEYEGGFKNGKPGGKGKILYNNGDSYEGEFIAGVPDGKGKLIHMTGEVIEGKFKGGKISK